MKHWTTKHSRARACRAFLLGIREFRYGMTTHFEDLDLLEAYDTGRELAHKLTLRRYEA
jgi:hypothetical protein